jgi:hypothetical protein
MVARVPGIPRIALNGINCPSTVHTSPASDDVNRPGPTRARTTSAPTVSCHVYAEIAQIERDVVDYMAGL